ncbi:MAG: YbjN domain-containing protein [Leptothrix ochracea]|uniref:YbjN domain-containing protein n=1 Tax=Leptothrix ochracea TaxID=735331 RepID=UPI0034E24247
MATLSRFGTFGVPLIALVLTQSAAAAQGSPSDVISAAHPAQILAVAASLGRAALGTNSTTGDPEITGQIGSKAYSLYFYGCKNNKNCTDIQFNAAWTHTQATAASLNQWHKDSHHGRAFLVNKDGDLVLQMPVNLAYGVTQANLITTFNDWILAVQDFETKVAQQAK